MMKFTTVAVAALLVTFAVQAQNAAGAHFIENWDLDRNQSVSMEELTQRRADVFLMFDVDGDQYLDAAEYVTFDDTRAADMENNAEGHGAGGRRMQQGLTLAFNDTDKDGKVSKEEFIDKTAAWLAEIDRDGDSAVTAADFGPRN